MEIEVKATVPLKVDCPSCGAAAGVPCFEGRPLVIHHERLREGAKAALRARAMVLHRVAA